MLEAKNLSCRRGGRAVFSDISFRLVSGSVLQVTGANGSGKTSLLRVLAGLLEAADGALLWHGAPVVDDAEAHRQRLHYIGHLDALKPEFTGAEIIGYWHALRPHALTHDKDMFGVSGFASKPIRTLSAGQKRRLTLTRLTMDDAPIWLLDEPMTALDEAGQKILLSCIEQHRAKGGIVVAAVHAKLDVPGSEILELKDSERTKISPAPWGGARGGVGEGAFPVSEDLGKTATPDPAPNPFPRGGGLVMCDFKMQVRHRGEWASLLLFFLIVILLLPFALGPEPNLLRRLAPGLIWLAALLMSLLALDRLFVQDARDGTMDLMLLSPVPLPVIVACKLFAQSSVMLVALLVMIIPASLMLGMSIDVLPVLAYTLLLGVPALVLLGGIAASLTVALQRNPALLTLLLVPFYIPILIFAVGAADAAAMQQSVTSNLALLGAILAVLIPTAPFVIATGLRGHN